MADVTRCRSPPRQATYTPQVMPFCRSSAAFKSTGLFLLSPVHSKPCTAGALAGRLISSTLAEAGLELMAILPQPPKRGIPRPF